MSIQNGILAKDKSYIQYDISPLSCGFENAVAITKLTIINTKRKNFFLLSVVCFQFVKNVFEFNSICADILNRRGTYVARYQRKIFKTTPVSPLYIGQRHATALLLPHVHICTNCPPSLPLCPESQFSEPVRQPSASVRYYCPRPE